MLSALRSGRYGDFALLAGRLGPEGWAGAPGEAVMEACMLLPAEALDAALDCRQARLGKEEPGEPAACRAARFGRADLLAALRRRGADMDSKDESGKSALHHAVLEGREKCAMALLEWGALPDQRDKDGRTPLALACAAGHKDLALALLSAGSDPCSLDDRGNALYDTARENCRALLEEPIGRRRSELDRLAVQRALGAGADGPAAGPAPRRRGI